MTTEAQLELFQENDEISLFRQEIEAMQKRYEKNGRTMLKRHNELAKLCLLLKEENDVLNQRLHELEKKQDIQKQPKNKDLIEKLFKEFYLKNDKENET